ncbi:MAG: hypothetical protein HYV47_00520 [Candidatus Nealsonbacteria bacterium]|nr:hypothetical protein [Candidatus Nealsonbacteria bacterium]
MFAKTIIIVPLFYFLSLLQISFLPHFSIFGITPNLIFVAVIFLAFFLPPWSVFSAFFGGFFLDIFSSYFFGFNVLILLGISLFIRLVLKRYVQVAF